MEYMLGVVLGTVLGLVVGYCVGAHHGVKALPHHLYGK